MSRSLGLVVDIGPSAVEEFKRRFPEHLGDPAFQFLAGPGSARLKPGDLDFPGPDPVGQLELGQAPEGPGRLESVI